MSIRRVGSNQHKTRYKSGGGISEAEQLQRWHEANDLFTTPGRLAELVADDHLGGVRGQAAGNPNTPPDVLQKLARDPEWSVREAVASNHSSPPKAFTWLLKHDGHTHDCIAQNPACPPRILYKLAKNANWMIRGAVINNPNTPQDLLRRLAQDSVADVAHAAQHQLETDFTQ